MPDADRYEAGDEPTRTRVRRGTGTSATGSNPGPSPRVLNEDAVQGTTSGERLHHKPKHGTRMDPDE